MKPQRRYAPKSVRAQSDKVSDENRIRCPTKTGLGVRRKPDWVSELIGMRISHHTKILLI